MTFEIVTSVIHRTFITLYNFLENILDVWLLYVSVKIEMFIVQKLKK